MKKSKIRAWVSVLAFFLTSSIAGGISTALPTASADAAEIMPIAKYEFKDENDLGKDSMGNYHMEYRNAYVAGGTGELLDEATLIDGGGIAFDGNLCLAQDAENNMFADVTSFTLCFEIKTGEHNKDWQHYLGVGNSTDEFAFIGADSASSNLYKLRLQAKGINGTSWNSEPIFGDGNEIAEFQKVIVSVQTGGTLQIWLNGNNLTLTKGNTVSADFATATKSSFFSIGGRYNGAVDRMSKGSIRNVAFYDFAMDGVCATAYNTNGKITADDLTGVSYITGASVSFEDEATSVALNSTMTEEEMLDAMNEATATLTLSNESTATTPITWTAIEKESDTYYAKGTFSTTKLGYANVYGTEISYALSVAELKELGEPVFTGEILKGEITDAMTEAEMLALINGASVTVTFEDDSTETVDVTFTEIKSKMGKYTAYADVVIGGQTYGTVSVPFEVTETNEGPTAELKPIALWTFDSEETKFSDAMGKYDLQGVARSGGNLGNPYGTGTVTDGVLYLDGDSIIGLPQLNDVGDHVNNGFTLNFQYKQDGTYTTSQGWSAPVSFGAADFGSSVGAGFIIADNSDDLRVQGHDITINMVSEEKSLYWTQTVVDNGSESWHNVTLSVRPGQFFNVYVDGVLAYTQECPASWNLEHTNMNFAIGGRCIWNNGYNLFKGWVDNVSVYNFAQSLEQSNAYWAKAKLVVGDMNGEIITSISDTPTYENGTLLQENKVLKDNLTNTQVVRRLNSATVGAVFDNQNTVDLPIEWLGYRQEGAKWYVIGEVDTSNLGYATTLTGKTEIKIEADVERVARTISFETMSNGSAEADKTSAYLGETVTITVTPNEGYLVKTVKVNGISLTENSEGKYEYIVEGIENLSVNVTFKADPNASGNSGGSTESNGCNGCGATVFTGSTLTMVLGMLAVGMVCYKRKKD